MNSFENPLGQSVVWHWMIYGQFVKIAGALVLGRKQPILHFIFLFSQLHKILCHKISAIPHYCNEWLQPLCYACPSQGLSHSKSCLTSTAGTLKQSQSVNVLKIDTFIKALAFLCAIKIILTVNSVLQASFSGELEVGKECKKAGIS